MIQKQKLKHFKIGSRYVLWLWPPGGALSKLAYFVNFKTNFGSPDHIYEMPKLERGSNDSQGIGDDFILSKFWIWTWSSCSYEAIYEKQLFDGSPLVVNFQNIFVKHKMIYMNSRYCWKKSLVFYLDNSWFCYHTNFGLKRWLFWRHFVSQQRGWLGHPKTHFWASFTHDRSCCKPFWIWENVPSWMFKFYPTQALKEKYWRFSKNFAWYHFSPKTPLEKL